jgi:hypothetical protein
MLIFVRFIVFYLKIKIGYSFRKMGWTDDSKHFILIKRITEIIFEIYFKKLE